MDFNKSWAAKTLFLVLELIMLNNINAEFRAQPCMDMFDLETIKERCCSLGNNMTGVDDYKSCASSIESWDCDSSICMLNKYKLLDKDGKVDMKSVVATIDQTVAEFPEVSKMADEIKEYCVKDNKYERYGYPDCLPMNFQMCSYIHARIACDLWKDSEVCQKEKENIKKCEAFIKRD